MENNGTTIGNLPTAPEPTACHLVQVGGSICLQQDHQERLVRCIQRDHTALARAAARRRSALAGTRGKPGCAGNIACARLIVHKHTLCYKRCNAHRHVLGQGGGDAARARAAAAPRCAQQASAPARRASRPATAARARATRAATGSLSSSSGSRGWLSNCSTGARAARVAARQLRHGVLAAAERTMGAAALKAFAIA